MQVPEKHLQQLARAQQPRQQLQCGAQRDGLLVGARGMENGGVGKPSSYPNQNLYLQQLARAQQPRQQLKSGAERGGPLVGPECVYYGGGHVVIQRGPRAAAPVAGPVDGRVDARLRQDAGHDVEQHQRVPRVRLAQGFLVNLKNPLNFEPLKPHVTAALGNLQHCPAEGSRSSIHKT